MDSGTSATQMHQEDRTGERDLIGLMVRYQNADADAIDDLVRLLSPRLLRFFAASGLVMNDAEDVTQDCWMRIHRSRHTYRPPEPVLPWIFAIARHTRLDAYRRRRQRGAKEVLVAEPPERVVQRPARGQNEVLRLLESLPQSQREVLLMLKVSGMSLEEAARATSSTVGSIKQKAHRAYATLRTLLEEGAQ
jgi:RNA polymerase sigma-70 factor (ECF subfamily)